jgi:hypothetical protein
MYLKGTCCAHIRTWLTLVVYIEYPRFFFKYYLNTGPYVCISTNVYEMVNYQNSKIYKLVNNVDDKIYVGSTCNLLRVRKSGHKDKSTKQVDRRVYAHLNAIGWDNVQIVLIEEFPCDNKMHLLKRERYWVDLLKPVLNTNLPTGGLCPHGKTKCLCVTCGGKSMCIHGKRKETCRPCGGIQMCIHGKQKRFCVPCGGTSICAHGGRKYDCVICSPISCECCGIVTSKTHINRHLKSVKHIRNFIWS